MAETTVIVQRLLAALRKAVKNKKLPYEIHLENLSELYGAPPPATSAFLLKKNKDFLVSELYHQEVIYFDFDGGMVIEGDEAIGYSDVTLRFTHPTSLVESVTQPFELPDDDLERIRDLRLHGSHNDNVAYLISVIDYLLEERNKK